MTEASVQIPFPAYHGSEPYIFVCYAHDDGDTVYPELAWLREQGVNVWYDEGITPGSEWSQALADALLGCASVLFFVSPRSVASEPCKREINFALSKELPICVVHLEETTLPASLELSLTHRQALLKYRLPMHVYQERLLALVRGDVSADATTETWVSPSNARSRLGVAALFVAAIVGGWWLWTSLSTEGYPATAIAVLPFEDLSPAGDQRWLANGMSEALVFYLARIEQLRVAEAPVDPAQPLDLKVLGERLRVGSVLRGSVQRSGDELVVTARLVRASDGAQLWSSRYDRVLDDVFDLQREITRSIVGAIEAELGVEMAGLESEAYANARFGARDVRAYELWRQTMDRKMTEDLGEAELREVLVLNLEAVAIDPEFAQGQVGLGHTYWSLHFHTHDPRDWESAKVALDRALALDSQNMPGAGVRAQMANSEGQWAVAANVIENVEPWTRVIELPGAFIAYTIALVNLGRWEDASAHVRELETLLARQPDRYPADHFARLEVAWGVGITRRDGADVIELLEPSAKDGAPWFGNWFGVLSEAYRSEGREADALSLTLRFLDEEKRALAAGAYAEGGWLAMTR